VIARRVTVAAQLLVAAGVLGNVLVALVEVIGG
jgi:hypothetical protein